MNRRIYILVNGILNFPGSSRNWTGRAVTWLHTHTEAKAEKVEYFSDVVFRAFGQKGRQEKLYRTLAFYYGWEIALVGHSNGCAVIIEMLRRFPCPVISEVHLVCGACNADFERNLLNAHLRSGKVRKVRCYDAGRDRALALAHTVPGQILGYGTLGLNGPLNVAQDVVGAVDVKSWPEYGHSDCWEDNNFDQTMNLLSYGHMEKTLSQGAPPAARTAPAKDNTVQAAVSPAAQELAGTVAR